MRYPTSTSSYRLRLGYDYQAGELKRIRDADGTTVFWEAVSTDAWGNLQDESFGNGVVAYTEFDQANGRMFKRQGGVGGGTGLLNALVQWDYNGNLTTRQDLTLGLTETFSYDALNRLDHSSRNGVQNLDISLDSIGNITYKSDVGSYTYHATKRRAVVAAGPNTYGYDANGNMTTRNGSAIVYTSYNLPGSIAQGSNSVALYYGASRNRYKQVAVSAGVTETSIQVAGILEIVSVGGVTSYRHRIDADSGTVAIYTRRSSGTPATSMYYVHRDHQGSPELVTDSSGALLTRLSFAAYGERRDAADWDGPVSAQEAALIGGIGRGGYTGHEHLDAVGLIHMNGRVYDPTVARFVSPDPMTQAGSQGPNRYAYVANNPLTLHDPTGFLTVASIRPGSRIYEPGPGSYTPGSTFSQYGYLGHTINADGDLIEEFNVVGTWNRPTTVEVINPGPRIPRSDEPTDAETPHPDEPPEGERQCVDKVQLAVGAMTTVAGTLQMMEGMFVTLVGLATVPAPGVNIGSPVAITFGLTNVAVGGANAADGVNQMIAAVGGADSRSTFGTMGQAIGGNRGGQLGDAAAILGNVALGIPGLARSVTASNRAGRYALANFALDSMTGVAAGAAGSRCP